MIKAVPRKTLDYDRPALQKVEKTTSKSCLESPSFQKFLFYCPTAQMAEVMVQNVAYRATVYRTGILAQTFVSRFLTTCAKNIPFSKQTWNWSCLFSAWGRVFNSISVCLILSDDPHCYDLQIITSVHFKVKTCLL
jgi:hypothetical protein